MKNRKTKSDENFSILNQSRNKYCFQYKLPDDLQEESKTATVWLGNMSNRKEKSDGILCEKINVENEENKEGCLKNISEKAAEIGNKTSEDWATEDGADKYNNTSSTKMNPFQVPIQSVFPITQDDACIITLYYHFGPFNHGYIVKVDAGNTLGEISYGTDLPAGKYSNIHDTTQKDNILDQANNKNDNIRFDAYTKLAGEGARFQIVRNNISTIKNDSIIWTSKRNEHRKMDEPGIKFEDLWKKWGKWFNKEFDIPNGKIADKLSNKKDNEIIDASKNKIESLKVV